MKDVRLRVLLNRTQENRDGDFDNGFGQSVFVVPKKAKCAFAVAARILVESGHKFFSICHDSRYKERKVGPDDAVEDVGDAFEYVRNYVFFHNHTEFLCDIRIADEDGCMCDEFKADVTLYIGTQGCLSDGTEPTPSPECSESDSEPETDKKRKMTH